MDCDVFVLILGLVTMALNTNTAIRYTHAEFLAGGPLSVVFSTLFSTRTALRPP